MKSSIAMFAVLIVGLVILGPLVFIWALNTLFPSLAIQYTFETWAAVVILNAFINTAIRVKK